MVACLAHAQEDASSNLALSPNLLTWTPLLPYNVGIRPMRGGNPMNLAEAFVEIEQTKQVSTRDIPTTIAALRALQDTIRAATRFLEDRRERPAVVVSRGR